MGCPYIKRVEFRENVMVFFSRDEAEFYKNNTKFQRKRSGQGLIGPPLKPPMEVVYAKSARTVF